MGMRHRNERSNGNVPVNEVATIPHTAGIRDAGTFRRRIMKLIQKPIEVGGPRRLALMLAYAAFGLATLFGHSVLPT
jgi:hypothetical protein